MCLLYKMLHLKNKIGWQESELDKIRRAKETENARKARLARKNDLDKAHRASESDNTKQIRLVKRQEPYGNKVASRRNNEFQDQDQASYLNQFDDFNNCPLVNPCWAKNNMQQFHKSMQLEIFQCTNCKEAWPLNSKPKSPSYYMCLRCSRDKSTPKKFSNANCMIPGPVPNSYKALLKQKKCSLHEHCQ